MVAATVEQVPVYEEQQDRIQKRVGPYTVATESRIADSKREIEWMGRDSNSRPPVCETGILTRLDYPSVALAFLQPII